MRDDLIAVRCCCNPRLVLGLLPRPAPGRTLVELSLRGGGTCTLEVGLATFNLLVTPEMDRYDATGALPPARERVLTEIAFKSNDTPLATLRQIPAFREINEPVPIGTSIAVLRQFADRFALTAGRRVE